MKRPLVVILLLVLGTLLVFLQTTHHPFIDYDDGEYIVNNPYVNQGLNWRDIRWAFTSFYASNWHPLTWISLMLDCDLFRLNPAGPHLVNNLFHAANAALVFIFVRRLAAAAALGTENSVLWVAILAGAFFAWHPLRVESVAWAAERKDVLSAFLSLLALLNYLRYGESKKTGERSRRVFGLYLGCLLCFILALLSKPMAVTLPVLMVLMDFWPLKRFGWRDTPLFNLNLWIEKVPFFLLSGALCFITVLAQHHAESSLTNVPLGYRLPNAALACVTYLGKTIWPAGLSIFYPYIPQIPVLAGAESALFLGCVTVLAWLMRRDRPWLIVGWIWFGVSLLPVIGLIQVGSQSMADRYTYFPSIGLILAVGLVLQEWAGRSVFLGKCLVASSLVLLAFCVWLTQVQLGYWKNTQTLFRHALEVHDSAVAHIEVGVALQDHGNSNEAMNQFLMALREQPDSSLGNYNLALLLGFQGKDGLAGAYFKRASIHDNSNPFIFEDFGRILVKLGHLGDARGAFEQAMKISPERSEPHFLLGRLYLKQGKGPAALSELAKAATMDPANVEILIFYASVLASSEDSKLRDGKEAEILAGAAVQETGGKSAAALDALAMAQAESGKFHESIQNERLAIALSQDTQGSADLVLLQEKMKSFQGQKPWRESFDQ